jgi:ferredoxin/flavodoxin---NADP+ reductase
MREMKTKLIECNSELGGKITMFYPEKTIRDIGGITSITGADLVKQLKEQAFTFKPNIICQQRISGLERLESGTFQLTSTKGDIHYTRTIILTVGAGIFQPIRLDIPGAKHFEKTNLHYTIEKLSVFENKRVVISGGGNTAVDWANELLPIAKSMTVIHRRDDFGGLEQNAAMMRKEAHTLTPYVIKELIGTESIEKIEILNSETGEVQTHVIDELIINHGITGDYGGMMEWGLEMEEGAIVVGTSKETNIPGIFAAGDAVTYPNKLKLIAGGFSEGPAAVNSAKKYIYPKKQVSAIYSTHHKKLLEKPLNR